MACKALYLPGIGEGNGVITEDIEARNSFLHTLEWLLAVMERYPSPLSFGLVHLQYGNRNELGETYGAEEAVRQLALVTESLKHTFRKTDMVARCGTDFWVLVPYTPATEKLYEKVLTVMQAAQHGGLNFVNREIALFSLPLSLGEQVKLASALDLLNYLKNNTSRFAAQVFNLSADAGA